MSSNLCYIGLGSNLGDSITIVNEAIEHLSHLPSSQFITASPLYSSEPVSEIKQNAYVNAVVSITTSLQPHELLLELQAIESAYYRQRDVKIKWGPRTLDLDIILLGELSFSDSHLTIPHPEFHQRLFVLKPLFDISGNIHIKGFGDLSHLIKNAPQYELHKLDDEALILHH